MNPLNEKEALEKRLINSFTTEQKRWILSLLTEQSVTLDGSDFVFEETTGETRLSTSKVDALLFDFINQTRYREFFSSGVNLGDYFGPEL